MKQKSLLVLTVTALMLAGCTSTTSPDTTGDFELLVSDAPAAIDDFDSLTVTFSSARVFKEAENSSDFKEIPLNGKHVDLTTVTGSKATSLVNTELEAGTYNKIELQTSDVTGVVNGSDREVKLPSEKLQIVKPFTINANTTTQFVFDIQVVLRGNQQNNEGYILKPVIAQSGVAGEDVDMEEVEQ